MSNQRAPQTYEYSFHGAKCEVFTTDDSLWFYSCCPWRFRIQTNSGWIGFGGMPNYCETKRSAMMRARARCKWIADGTFDNRYK